MQVSGPTFALHIQSILEAPEEGGDQALNENEHAMYQPYPILPQV